MAILSCHVSIKLPPKISDGQSFSTKELIPQPAIPTAELFDLSFELLGSMNGPSVHGLPNSWPAASTLAPGTGRDGRPVHGLPSSWPAASVRRSRVAGCPLRGAA